MTDIEIVEAIKAEIQREFTTIDFIEGYYETPRSMPAALVAITGCAPAENNACIISNPIIDIAIFEKSSKQADLKYNANFHKSRLNKRLMSILNLLISQSKLSFTFSNVDNDTLIVNGTNAGDCVVSAITITIN